MQSYDNHSFPTPPCLLLREQQGELQSNTVEDDGHDLRLPFSDLKSQFIDMADERIMVHRTDIHASIQSEIRMEMLLIVHV